MIELTRAKVGAYAAERHLANMAWLGADVQACHSIGPQMIAAQRESISSRCDRRAAAGVECLLRSC